MAVDVGTTGTKALLVSEKGETLGSAYVGYETIKSQPGYSEQNALDWWNALINTVKDVCRDILKEEIVAISLSVQGGTLVPTDRNFNPLKNAVVWDDARCEKERDQFLKEVGPASVMYERTGWGLCLGLPALQIRWIKNHEPELFATRPMFLTVADYISAKLTGKPCVDFSNAGINELVDIRKGCYDKDILNFAGITADQLPVLVKSGTVIGTLTAEAAKVLDLSEKTVLVAGAHDQYAVAIGGGAVKAGDILIGSGTSWAITAIDKKTKFETGLAQSIAATEGMWGSLTSLSSGGVCLEWLRKYIISEGTLSLKEIDKQCASAIASSNNLFFFPFGSLVNQNSNGKMIPTGTFTGMDLSNDKYDLSRAIMEGVGFQIKRMLERFENTYERIKLAGGASKSMFWTQVLADILGKPVVISEVSDLACVGAAILAGVGCGIFSNTANGYERLSIKEKVVLPSAESKNYAIAYETYNKYASCLLEMYQK